LKKKTRKGGESEERNGVQKEAEITNTSFIGNRPPEMTKFEKEDKLCEGGASLCKDL